MQLTQYEAHGTPTEESCGEWLAARLDDAKLTEAALQKSVLSGAVAETSRTEFNY